MENLFTLQLKLSVHRQRLEMMVNKYGPLHPKVISQSQRLDEIVVKIQKLFAKQLPNVTPHDLQKVKISKL